MRVGIEAGRNMGRETIRFVDEEDQRAKKGRLHPIWRGVGCLGIVVFGILGYYLSGWLLEANVEQGWIYIPPEIMAPEFLPWLPPGTLLRLVVAVLAVMLGLGVINMVYAFMFPIIPGETDVLPLKPSSRRKL